MSSTYVTLAQAARHSPLSLATIRRRLQAGKIEGAVRNADRSWSIPVATLVADGIWPSTTPADDDQDDAPSAPAPDLTAEIERLTAELAAMRHRAQLAERLRDAAERNADDLRTAMRMLEAGPAPQRRRRRWWQRSVPDDPMAPFFPH